MNHVVQLSLDFNFKICGYSYYLYSNRLPSMTYYINQNILVIFSNQYLHSRKLSIDFNWDNISFMYALCIKKKKKKKKWTHGTRHIHRVQHSEISSVESSTQREEREHEPSFSRVSSVNTQIISSTRNPFQNSCYPVQPSLPLGKIFSKIWEIPILEVQSPILSHVLKLQYLWCNIVQAYSNIVTCLLNPIVYHPNLALCTQYYTAQYSTHIIADRWFVQSCCTSFISLPIDDIYYGGVESM